MNDKPKLFLGITAPLSVVLLKGQLQYFVKQGYRVFLLAPETEGTLEFCRTEGGTLLPVPIKREISIINDIRSLWIILKHFRRHQPDVVNVGTPKMGLLGIIGAWLMHVPVRIYTCRGFRYEHEKGLKQALLIRFEKLINSCSTKIICISNSVLQKGLEDGVFDSGKTVVIGHGSSNGVDLLKFNTDRIAKTRVVALRELHGLKNKFVFGFVGRIVDRKGVNELYEAFNTLNRKYPDTHLIIVGKANLEQVTNSDLMNNLEAHPAISLTGYVYNVPEYMKLFDVFVLPAWWEGFGNALIQAASMGLPIISCDVTGCRDAVSNNYNGWLIEPKNSEVLKESMVKFYESPELRRHLGTNGLKWAQNFKRENIWEEMVTLYNK